MRHKVQLNGQVIGAPGRSAATVGLHATTLSRRFRHGPGLTLDMQDAMDSVMIACGKEFK